MILSPPTPKFNQWLWKRQTNKFTKLYPLKPHMKKVAYNKHKQRRRRPPKKATTATTTTDDSKGPSTVVNLSGVALNEGEIHLLSRGPSFCPTPCHLNKRELLDNPKGVLNTYAWKSFLWMKKKREGMMWIFHSNPRAHGCLPRVEMLSLKLT